MEHRKKFGWKESSLGLRIFTVGVAMFEALTFAFLVLYIKSLPFYQGLFFVYTIVPLILIMSFWSRRDYSNWAKRQGYEDTKSPRPRSLVMILVVPVVIVAMLVGFLFGLRLI
jgi:uncharacterized membrane protein YidH (DUF202 family)